MAGRKKTHYEKGECKGCKWRQYSAVVGSYCTYYANKGISIETNSSGKCISKERGGLNESKGFRFT